MPIVIKSPSEIKIMREAGRIVATVLGEVRNQVRPGKTTGELDALAERTVVTMGAIPSFKGLYGFPASVCISVNEEVVHGIPQFDRFLNEGDILSLDFGAFYQGMHGDSAVTVPVGTVSDETRRLLAVGEASLWKGIEQLRPGKRIGDISWAIQSYVEAQKFSVVRQYVGHAVGRNLHEEPQVPNFGPPGRGLTLRRGMTIALEPMVNAGTHETEVLDDQWTVVTKDRKLSVHFEHTVAITDAEPLVLTVL